MTPTRKLALALCLALSFTHWHSNSQTLAIDQTGTTGNLVDNNWTNGVNIPSLNQSCWTGGQPGYCGPAPRVSDNGMINFSYGMTDLHQQRAMAAVLPNMGTGLQITGFNFSFTAKNGNGWDDGRVDYLVAYTRFHNSTGAVAADYNYDLNYKFNWTTFNYNQNFAAPLAVSNLSTVRYGFVGRDNNFWAGPYGPEIHNVNFRLNYSVDPCSVDPTSSPSCPGYLDAIRAKLPKPEPEPQPMAVSEPAPVQTSTAPEPVPQTEVRQQTDVAGAASQLPPAPGNVGPAAGPVAQQARAAEPQGGAASQSRSSGSAPSLTQILGIVRNEQSRISAVETTVRVNEQNRVSAVEAASMQAVATQNAQTQAQALATVQQSLGSAVLSALSQDNKTQSSQGSAMGNATTQGQGLAAINNMLQQNNAAGSVAGPGTQGQNQQGVRQTEITATTDSDRHGFIAVDVQRQETPRLVMMPEVRQSDSTVKRDVANNDAAQGGPTLQAMAMVPTGFAAYSITLQDAPGYAPREIYRNQRNVDNDAVRRRMFGGSDALHQRMVDQQYQQGR